MWLAIRLAVALAVAVVPVADGWQQTTEMLIRLKSVEFDPQTTADAVVPADWDRWIVQFRAPLTAESQARLRREYGLALSRYIPDGAYLERADAQKASRLRADSQVRWVGPYLPAYKLDSTIARRREEQPAGEIAVVAEGYDDSSSDDLLLAIQRAGFGQLQVIRVPAGSAPRVRLQAPASTDLAPLTRLREIFFIEAAPRMVIDRPQ